MSLQPTKLRPRRASRAPGTFGDENAVAVSTVAGKPARIVSKLSTGAVKRPLSVASAKDAVLSGKQALAPRRALGDVSNAISKVVDRSSKEMASRTTRTRPISTTSTASTVHPPSSTGTRSLARLSITQPSRSKGATASRTSKDINNARESTQDEDVVEVLPQPDEAAANMVDSPRIHGHKRRQGSDISSDEVNLDERDVADKVRIVDADFDDDDWVAVLEGHQESIMTLDALKAEFEENLDFFDPSMVAEYADEIFEYMSELELKTMPNPKYMEQQSEIKWHMRATLIDWLMHIHMRYHMLPETLWIAVNIIDRFLSTRVVSLPKFQLVGVTAMFIAAKYEEIVAPSVEEFVFMTESGFKKEEILKGERIVLSSLQFNISEYCSPYTWVRRISKADSYDIQTRTLSKFLMEIVLLDHRFLRAKPSLVAAVGMYVARLMLGNSWSRSFVYYSGYTELQLATPAKFIIENIAQPDFESKFVYKKYASKKFLKASVFSLRWVRDNGLTFMENAEEL